jgi:hypothetical protein
MILSFIYVVFSCINNSPPIYGINSFGMCVSNFSELKLTCKVYYTIYNGLLMTHIFCQKSLFIEMKVNVLGKGYRYSCDS